MSARRIIAPVAPVHREPHPASEQVSQYRFGHLLVPREQRGDWVLGRGFDDYEGWVHEGYLGGAEELARAWRDARVSLGCRIVFGERVLDVPLGALVPEGASMQAGEAISDAERARRFPSNGAAIASSATSLFPGTAYLWGGITPWGADCSGFTQTIFALHGIPLPRDSAQQALQGESAPDDPLALSAADLLFFSDREDGPITHVAIALGGGRIAHVALGRGGHRVEDLHAPDDYIHALLQRFRFARQVLAP